MSGLKEQIKEEIKTAMKAREQRKLLVLRGLMAEIQRAEIDLKQELDEGRLLSLVQKEIKKRRDALEFAEKAQREDLIAQNKHEIEILETYLGEQLSEGELRDTITRLIAEGSDSVGQIMGALNKDFRGRFDGKTASAMARELLG